MVGFSWEISEALDIDDDSEFPDEPINLFNKYQRGKLLGYGAFGKVYHARNIHTGKSVAIKALSKHKILRGKFTENVKREIAVMRRLHHPNVVELEEVLASKNKIYFVMEFAKGGALISKLRKAKYFSEDLSRRYFQQLMTAVKYCHERGVFHRDLKLENILMDENSNIKISDFGLSALKDQIGPDGRLHTVCGSPGYIAPEVLAKKGYDGAKVDIWSCGVILFGLTAGYLPFKDSNLTAMYRKIRKGEYRCPKWISEELKWFMSRLLDPNPDTRITIDEVLRDPWFKEDYREIKVETQSLDLRDDQELEQADKYLNAFEIISLSPGFDLSGLFNESDDSARGELFVSADSPEIILERVEELAKEEDIVTRRENWKAKLEGQHGSLIMIVEIYRLTDKLVMVEVELNAGAGQDIWKNKLRPQLSSLICQQGLSVSSN